MVSCGGSPINGACILKDPLARKSQSVVPAPLSQRPGVSVSVDAFRRILRALRLASRQTEATAGISAAQLYVLQALGDGAEASLSQIAARTMTDRTSVAAVVERLVAGGLASREPSRVDRRRASICISAKGRSLLRRAPRAPTALLVEGLEGLDSRKLASLSSGLVALNRAMGLVDQPAGMLFDDRDDAPPRTIVRPSKPAR